MTKFLLLLPLLFGAAGASAIDMGPLHLDGHGAFGYNSVQGNYYNLGVDLYTYAEDHLAVGAGFNYSFGDDSSWDREYDVGPFVGYSYPLFGFLVPSIREDIDYVDERDPVLTNGTATGYQQYYGIASFTSVAMYIFFTKNLGVGVGYRLALGLNNSNLEKDHSGAFFGLALGF